MNTDITTRGPYDNLRFKTEIEYVPVHADTVIRTIKLNKSMWWEWSKETTIQWQFFYDIAKNHTKYPSAKRAEYLYNYFQEKGCLAPHLGQTSYVGKYKDGNARINSRVG